MTKKVLLADDEERTRALVLATLRNDAEYQIITASDGVEALYVARRELPDLMFLDIRMPKMDGFQVCEALKKDPDTARIKVVMLSALAQEADFKKAKELGADAYITKPFSPLALLRKVDEVLGL